MSGIVKKNFNHLYLQGYQPLQNHPEDCYKGSYQDATGVWESCPCQQEAAKKLILCPNSQSLAPTLIIIKEKMGE
jgi:hypothetical protein